MTLTFAFGTSGTSPPGWAGIVAVAGLIVFFVAPGRMRRRGRED